MKRWLREMCARITVRKGAVVTQRVKNYGLRGVEPGHKTELLVVDHTVGDLVFFTDGTYTKYKHLRRRANFGSVFNGWSIG